MTTTQNQLFCAAIIKATGESEERATQIVLALTNDERLRLSRGGLNQQGLVAAIAANARARLPRAERIQQPSGDADLTATSDDERSTEASSDQQSAVSDQPVEQTNDDASSPTVDTNGDESTVETDEARDDASGS